ncbi:hypothetical protein MUA52_08340 [Staphylococcus agnetis]|nr:hypothetical protein [Staphylococcus agnetis]UXU63549.1 hypothetical protein MUA84_08405 [Staphylococcus agnetis]UXU65831.1 hypothetical protein MUA52_08340 [Staphylococcus agnetis]
MTNEEIYELLDEITDELKRVTLYLDDEDMSEIASVVNTIESVACNYE